MRYRVYLTWRCDHYEEYCTDNEVFEVEDLEKFLIELPKKIESIEKRGTIISIQVSKIDNEASDKILILLDNTKAYLEK